LDKDAATAPAPDPKAKRGSRRDRSRAEREARLAEALRRNLKRRKAQERTGKGRDA